MDEKQLQTIKLVQQRDHRPKVTAAQFASGGDRTLIYGYTAERDTFHVYVQDGRLHRFVYRQYVDAFIVVSYESAQSMHGTNMVPGKAIYWRRSDFDAVWFLAVLDVYMHFKESGPAVIERTEKPQFEGVVYDPEKHTTREPQSTAGAL